MTKIPEKCPILNINETASLFSRSFSLDVLDGLSSKPKIIPSKYLYDEKGSRLFEKITELAEYYPTKCELEILKQRQNDINQIIGGLPFRLIELGVGDGKKTRVLLRSLLDQGFSFEYVLVDVCEEMIGKTASALQKEFQGKGLAISGIAADYSSALLYLKQDQSFRNIVLFLGASIGNFENRELEAFLHEMWNALQSGDLVFIGFDLKKDIEKLQQAYNDKGGVTREFTLNLLDRMNRELSAEFNRGNFVYHSFYNPSFGRMESWILSVKRQSVRIQSLQKAFEFEPWEGIHVENSYKYNLTDIHRLADTVGFAVKDEFIDSKGYFVDAMWQVVKDK